jgi:hypothetical protein
MYPDQQALALAQMEHMLYHMKVIMADYLSGLDITKL